MRKQRYYIDKRSTDWRKSKVDSFKPESRDPLTMTYKHLFNIDGVKQTYLKKGFVVTVANLVLCNKYVKKVLDTLKNRATLFEFILNNN